MKSDWNKMDASQKKEAIVLTAMPAIALIFIVLDRTETQKITSLIRFLPYSPCMKASPAGIRTTKWPFLN